MEKKTFFEIKLYNPERLKEIMNLSEDFKREAGGLFLETVFQIHKYLIRVTPLDTGELRGGWTSLLLKYGQDFSSQLGDVSLYEEWKQANKTEYYKRYHFTPSEFQKGVAASSLSELTFDITVINNVKQGIYMEYGTSNIPGRFFTNLARFKGEAWFNEKFDEWYTQIARAEKITPHPPQVNKPIPN